MKKHHTISLTLLALVLAVYFVTNQRRTPEDIICNFRVEGKVPVQFYRQLITAGRRTAH